MNKFEILKNLYAFQVWLGTEQANDKLDFRIEGLTASMDELIAETTHLIHDQGEKLEKANELLGKRYLQYEVRKLTDYELIRINDAMAKWCGVDSTGIEAKDYYSVAIDGYQSDSPGYTGTVYIVIWGEPCFVNVFIEEGEELVVQPIE